jgi:hypothetical protein
MGIVKNLFIPNQSNHKLEKKEPRGNVNEFV